MGTEENKFKEWLNSDWFQVFISVICGIVICAIIENVEWNAIIIETTLGSLFSYATIYMFKNPYGKFSKDLKDNNDVIQKLNATLTESEQLIELNKKELNALLDSLKTSDQERANLSKQSITALVNYLSEEAFGKCSNKNGNCSSCDRYKSTCDGLFRTYLYEDCRKLAESIEEVNSAKKYKLNNNIPFYHTLAIKQLKLVEGDCYRVVQPLLDKKEPVYDKMDIDFLDTFIRQIFLDDNYAKQKQFKVQWLFVGVHSSDIAKNNYKYLVDELKKRNAQIKEAFAFKTIPQDVFLRLRGDNKRIEETKIDAYYKKNPSLGIFGDGFVFVDAGPEEDQHGTMYSNTKDVSNLIKFYDQLWKISEAKTIQFEELVNYCG